MKAAVCLLLLVAVVARAQNGGGGGELHYEQAAYSDNAAADAQALDQMPFDADNTEADSEVPMQEQEQEQYDQESSGETEESDEADVASLAEVDSGSAESGPLDFLKHPKQTLSAMAHKVSDGIKGLKKMVKLRRTRPAPTPQPVPNPPRVTPVRRPPRRSRPATKRRPTRRPSTITPVSIGRPAPRVTPRPKPRGGGGVRPRPRSSPTLSRPIIAAGMPTPQQLRKFGGRPRPTVRRPNTGGRRPSPAIRSRPRPRPVYRPRPRGRGRPVRGFPSAPPAAGGSVDGLWHSERHDFGPKNADRDPEMAKLNLALEAVKEDILSTNKQINDERRWVIAVSKIITSYNTKMKRVESHIVTLRKEMKMLYKKKKQIENLKLQRLLEAKLKEARDELATLTNSLKHVATKQSELNKSGADLRMTIAGIQAQLAKLRGQQMMKKCKRGFKYSKKAKKCVNRCKKGQKWKGKGKKGRCVPKKRERKEGPRQTKRRSQTQEILTEHPLRTAQCLVGVYYCITNIVLPNSALNLP